MIPLLFLNPGWVRENPVLTVLIAVIFVSLSIAVVDKWKNRNG
jgi:hypothetical protein